jgi:hypothetical protein
MFIARADEAFLSRVCVCVFSLMVKATIPPEDTVARQHH